MLNFNNVSFSYFGHEILNDVSLEIRAGEFVVLLGDNGAGKSTMLRLCNGLLKPDRGSVKVCGNDTLKVKTSRIAGQVGFLFQNPDRQICQKTVREEIAFGLDNPAIDAQLAYFGLDGERDPFEMSRGERQRVALASVLVREPELLLLDEPTVGLDRNESRELMNSVRRQQLENRAAVLMITHDLEIADEFANRQILLCEGQLIFENDMVSGLKGD
jgi:energy-coupling factor transport system ATP-binding protein